MRGTIIIVQESRFQLVDDSGVGHLLTLHPNAAAEPDQLVALARRQVRVDVRVKPGKGLVGQVATAIDVV